MSDWTAGYVSDIDYTYGYYTELNPFRTRLAFLRAGLVPPTVETACELGFGQGMAVNIHAASSGVRWYGTDFNPGQAAFAQELARACDNGARLCDDAFEAFCNREDLPDFDFIALHGIWSWISEENRRCIADFIARKLKVGGVAYISYNSFPGWAPFMPMRNLLTTHAERMGGPGQGIEQRITGALAFANDLLAVDPAYAKASPLIKRRLEKIAEQDAGYIAHEYFNRDWHPMDFCTMAEYLEGAKLDFACSAHYHESMEGLSLNAKQLGFLSEIPDRKLREATKDLLINQQFRRDYWVKGARKLTALEQAEMIRAQRVVLAVQPEQVELKIKTSVGEASLAREVYQPVIDALEGNQATSIGELEQALKGTDINFSKLFEAVMVLSGTPYLQPVQDAATIDDCRQRSAALNRHLAERSRGSNAIGHLSSPVTGGGVNLDRFQQLFLLAQAEGHKKPEDWAAHAWKLLAAQGQRMVAKGETLQTPEENVAALQEAAEQFARVRMPLMEALQVKLQT